MHQGLLVGLLLPLGLLLGCRAPATPAGATAVRVSAADETAQKTLYEVVQDGMRDHSFKIDRVDRRDGVITSLPETSRHYFEFWRHDVVTPFDVWESTINPIRRWVEARIAPSPGGNGSVVAIAVHKERLSSPDRQFNNSTAAYRFFGDALPSTTGLVRVTPEHDRWLPIGRDPALEACLVTRIASRANAAGLPADEIAYEWPDETRAEPPVEVATPADSSPAETPGDSGMTPAAPVEPRPQEARPPAQESAPQPPPVPAPDGSTAIVPLKDVEGSTP